MRWLRRYLVVIIGIAVLVYIQLPNIVVAVFSFNKPPGRYNIQWSQFSFAAWQNICGNQSVCNAFGRSVTIALISAAVATVIGTAAAFALGRYKFRGRAITNLLVFMPMTTPEVVMGSSLLTLFITARMSLGMTTVLLAHITFTVSFVITTVKARVATLDPALEQAAADLYATPAQTFWKITFPLVAPGIGAGALLALALSFDDYIVTAFNAGTGTVTFPMFIWGAESKGLPVQVNVIGTIMTFGVLIAATIGLLIRGRMRAGRPVGRA
jgi:spermidine/putrescine transport system permease protein